MRKVFRFLFFIVIVSAGIIVVLTIFTRPIPQHPYFSKDDVLVMAHRGGRGLWPENTLYAFERAAETGVDILEMDIHSTKDGSIILLHDSTVDRTTDGTGPVNDFNLADLKKMDAGYHWTTDEGQTYPYRSQNIVVPTLEEVFLAFPDFHLNIEIKQTQPPITGLLCETIRKYNMVNSVLIASFDMDTIKEFRNTCPEVATTAGEDEVRMLYVLSRLYLERLYSPTAEAVQVPEYRGDIHVALTVLSERPITLTWRCMYGQLMMKKTWSECWISVLMESSRIIPTG